MIAIYSKSATGVYVPGLTEKEAETWLSEAENAGHNRDEFEILSS